MTHTGGGRCLDTRRPWPEDELAHDLGPGMLWGSVDGYAGPASSGLSDKAPEARNLSPDGEDTQTRFR